MFPSLKGAVGWVTLDHGRKGSRLTRTLKKPPKGLGDERRSTTKSKKFKVVESFEDKVEVEDVSKSPRENPYTKVPELRGRSKMESRLEGCIPLPPLPSEGLRSRRKKEGPFRDRLYTRILSKKGT